MNAETYIQSIILIFFGFIVLYSYYKFLQDKSATDYFSNKYWFNLNKIIIYILFIFQCLAVIGFLVAIISWIVYPPKGGTFASSSWILFTFVLCFFIFSALWSYFVYSNNFFMTILSLIIVAVISIILLAMSVEETNPRWYITLGLLFLCITTVLGDAIIWNANYIHKNLS